MFMLLKHTKEGSSMKDNGKKNLMTLPHELIVEILVRLPVRSLLRCKSVCRSWLSLISNPQFAISHFDLNVAPTHRLLIRFLNQGQIESIALESSIHDPSALVTLNLPPPSLSCNHSCNHCNPLRFLGSCRGFMLLAYQRTKDVIVWNPSTRFHQSVRYLLSDNFNHHSLYGFGYDKSTNDYLVVLIAPYNTKTLVATFFLKTESWDRDMHFNVQYEDFGYELNAGVLSNDSFHWLVTATAKDLTVVIAYDFVEKSLLEIPLPTDLAKESTDGVYKLMVVGDCLSLCNLNDWPEIAEIWVMKEYKVQSSWTKAFNVSVSEIPSRQFFPIFFTEGGGVLGSNGSGGTLLKFNEKGRLLEQRKYRRDYKDAVEYVEMYQESLLSFPSEESLRSNFEKATEDDQQ